MSPNTPLAKAASLPVILLFFNWIFNPIVAYSCPVECICKNAKSIDHPSIKLRCGSADNRINDLSQVHFWDVKSFAIQLNLSDNLLNNFKPDVELLTLQKLDLSRNKFTELTAYEFERTPNLRRLDLSLNQIFRINAKAFQDLTYLERLKLNGNQITTISAGLFDDLSNLKQLDISSNPLHCDCSLQWLLDFIQSQTVKLLSGPKCNTPSHLKDAPFRKVKITTCASIQDHLIISPTNNQVLFEGDSFTIECSLSSSENDTAESIIWSQPETWATNNVNVTTFQAKTVIEINNVKQLHSGLWGCHHGNHTKQFYVYVIGSQTQFCTSNVTRDNKGVISWPTTMQNVTVHKSCDAINSNVPIDDQFAQYECSIQGQWENLNTSRCQYVSENTRILEQFANSNSSLMESAKHFRNYTKRNEVFEDVVDLKFAVETMEKYLNTLGKKDVGGVVMDILDGLMELPMKYLLAVDEIYGICDKLVEISEQLADVENKALVNRKNLMTQLISITSTEFTGLKCTWSWNKRMNKRQSQCDSPQNSVTGVTDTVPIHNSDSSDSAEMLASVSLPATLLLQFGQTLEVFEIFVAFHSTNKFFPFVSENNGMGNVMGPVIGTKLLNITSNEQLIDPIVVTLKTTHHHRYQGNTTPVWYNDSWNDTGCAITDSYSDYIVLDCYKFGYYGLLRHMSDELALTGVVKFKLSHLAIYVGSFVLLLSFSVVILVYTCHFQSIQMPKNSKHSHINLWTSVWLLCLIYNLGIHTEYVNVCQIVGVALHFFSLASLLWFCICLNCLYRKLTQDGAVVSEDSDEDIMSGLNPAVKKSLSGIYFLGWGVAAIVCGLTIAININEYVTAPLYCFLRPGPPMSALYLPAIVICACSFCYFVLARCALYAADVKSEGTQVTEHVDLEQLGGEERYCQNSQHKCQKNGTRMCQNQLNRPGSRTSTNTSSSSTSSYADDGEHSARAQLYSLAIFFIFYLSSWILCAVATRYRSVQWLEDLFSVLYACTCTILGAFVLFFHCVSREDVRTSLSKKNQKNTVKPTNRAVTNPVVMTTRTSSRSSGAVAPSGGDRFINIIPPMPRVIENPHFCNPHQSAVARRFFKRQRRQQQRLRSNNIMYQRKPGYSDDDSAALSSIYGTSSKVNNTNIHVVNNDLEKSKEYKYGGYDNKKAAKVNNVDTVKTRSISQQCSLEYSSESMPGFAEFKTCAEVENVDRISTTELQEIQKSNDRKICYSVTELDGLSLDLNKRSLMRSWQQLKCPNGHNGNHSDSEVYYKRRAVGGAFDVIFVKNLNDGDLESTV